MKRCCRCKVELPLDVFGPDTRRPDGRAARCRPCAAAYLRDWKKANRDKVKAINTRWNTANRRYFRERIAAWRAANPELARAADKRWRDANPEKIRQKDMRRRAALLGIESGDVDLAALWAANEGTCQLCLQPIDRTLPWPDPMSASVDHIVPLSRGGRHEQSNLQWTHLVENIQKGAKTPVPLGG